MKRMPPLIAILFLLSAPTAVFASGDASGSPKPAASATAAGDKTTTTEGEVKRVDKDTGKVTIKHGEIKNLDMPPMTMVFRVKEATMLDRLKVGDKIKFDADNVDGKITVTQFEMAK